MTTLTFDERKGILGNYLSMQAEINAHKATTAHLTVENERLKRVVEQATKGLVIAPGGIMRRNWITGQLEPSGLFIDGSPDLVDQLKAKEEE
jgi:hypothetical protein